MNRIKKTFLSVLICFSSSPLFAANDGPLAGTSQGDFDLILAVQDLVRVSRLDDLNFGLYVGTGSPTNTEDFCVYRSGTGAYQVTLTGDGAANAFTVTDGTNIIPYAVEFDDSVAGGEVTATTGVAITGQVGDPGQETCGDTDNASIDITFNQTDLQAAPTGNYNGTLTILIAAE